MTRSFGLCFVLVLACTPATQERPPASAARASPEPSAITDAGADSSGAAVLAHAQDRTLRQELVGGDPTYVGVLDRQGLNAIIEQGLGRVLAKLKLSPAMLAGRFQGFRVREIDAAWSGAGLIVGDVLLRVNGQSIERPEQAQLAFDSLRVASEVALELMRGGEKMSLRYRVE